MTNMENAMKEAGLRLPTINHRVWHWLKDNPHKNYKAVAAALGISVTTASTACSDLAARGLLKSVKEAQHKGGKYPSARYSICVSRYEVRPYVTPKPLKNYAETKQPTPSEVPVAKPESPETTAQLTGISVANLKVLEAYTLFLELSKMFKT